jgi:soluble lytic murein transglycosylase
MRRPWRVVEVLCLALVLASSAALPVRAQDAVEVRAIAGLRGGSEALARGDLARAAERFDAAAKISEIAPQARALAARAWLDAGKPAEAEASARAGLDVSDALASLWIALAEAREEQGDPAAARAAWKESLRHDADASRAAHTRLVLADSLARASEIEAAAHELREVWIGAAERDAAALAGERLDALEREVGRSLRTASDWLRRADRLFDTQRSAAALDAYERVLASTAASGERTRAARRRADCLFRLRRYPEAAAAFGALRNDAEMRLWHARSLARADRVEEAIAELESVGAGSGPTSAWARLLAGLLHEGRGREERARTLFAAAVEGASERVATDALWRLAWGAWRTGDSDTARRRFEGLAAQQRDPLDRLAARYWAARALEARDPGGAARERAAIATEYPFSYYGWRAGATGGGRTKGREPIDDGAPALDERDLLPARALIAAGLPAAGLEALARPAGRARNVDDRIAVARAQHAAGDYHAAQSLLVGAYAGSLARGVVAGQEELWTLAWPDAFAAERRVAMPRDAVIDPWLVASILREESGYRREVVSVSGAVGLLQLMPDTAARLAAEAGVPDFTAARLVEPELNLRLGAFYLDRLARRFGGSLEPTIASYNAGPEAVTSWRRGVVPGDDEWVESIPYEETRAYVKRVLRSLHVHRTLYQ